ncbi:DinB family protein [Aureicoccus marinus]|uniref:Damage-inducible protein DinB n=1 Tax=Aureicoccus marinus TaxID=754435 RepID=A0A2S7T814_9FLAO|nr:DinB family protein [Aureicoccus marinus]PQJ16072.1 damage-inducible protein DinB [Aureicoccus marinus]
MKQFFQELLDYNYYCNKAIMEQLIALDSMPEQSHKLFSHILNAHHIWNHRILETPSEFEVWQLHDAKEWEEMHYDNQRTTFEIISGRDEFDQRVDYTSTEGRTFSNSMSDILFHITNHSTHHRGQIMTELRALGHTPQPLDYIFYKR